jgi:predicted GNAT family acetyltransferase
VYTPPERRRRGFGAALTAAATQAVLDEGAIAALFTELVNPVSNALYQRLGYEPVSELVRYRFGVA